MNGKQGIAIGITIILMLGIYMFYGNNMSGLEIEKTNLSGNRSEIRQKESTLKAQSAKLEKERVYLVSGVGAAGLIITMLLRNKKDPTPNNPEEEKKEG